jgi:hypothetical protein
MCNNLYVIPENKRDNIVPTIHELAYSLLINILQNEYQTIIKDNVIY